MAAYLAASGFSAGYSQGNAVSVWICILAIDPFLRAVSRLAGVHAVLAFCDDWTISFDSMETAERLSRLIAQFGRAFGQSINCAKYVWVPSQALNLAESSSLLACWAEPLIWRKRKSMKHKSFGHLGYWFGPDATMVDFTDDILQKQHGRFLELERLRLSLTSHILSINVHVSLLFSYVFGYACVGESVQRA